MYIYIALVKKNFKKCTSITPTVAIVMWWKGGASTTALFTLDGKREGKLQLYQRRGKS